MQEADLEPPIIEDLVRYGRERGMREGVERGVEVGTRQGLLALISVRGLALSPEQREYIEREHDAERLLGWLRRAAFASSVDDVLRG